MDHNFPSSSVSILLCFPLFLFFRGASSTTITLLNKCDYTVWPGILPNAGSFGFELPEGSSKIFQPPLGWSGRVWARTHCNQIECNGSGASSPATLAEFTLGSGSGAPDYYDVSLVDGFNVPMVIEARGGSGSCLTTGCVSDLKQHCPNELRTGDGSACRSACEAFGTPQYCCSGAYGSPATCKPSMYSQMFKSLCPRAYSYAYDDASSTFTCVGADYTITFCPSFGSQRKSSSDYQSSSADQLPINGFGFGSGSGPGIGSTPGSCSSSPLVAGSGPGFSSSSGSSFGSNTGSGFGSGSDFGSNSYSSSRHGPRFFIGGGQMLPSISPPRCISYSAWQLIILIILTC